MYEALHSYSGIPEKLGDIRFRSCEAEVDDLLRNGIYELRAKVGTVNYRVLYFFCGSNVACLSHGLTKGQVFLIPTSTMR